MSLNENKILCSNNKTKTAWSIYNQCANKSKSPKPIALKNSNNEIIEDLEEIAGMFLKKFNVPSVVPSSASVQVPRSHIPTIFLFPTDAKEVQHIILGLPNKYSAGLDEIPIIILKKITQHIEAPLAHIINACLNTGIFPSRLKRAKVAPIFKNKGDEQDIDNYRPISLLSSISKIFERVIYIRIMNFLKMQNILSSNQFGFRPNHSTQLAIFKLISFVIENIDRNKKVAGLFFDLSKAFDTINHPLLLSILENCGLRGNCARLIASYLDQREQTVCLGSGEGVQVFSTSSLVEQGVPQGSILGPVLFILYVNGLSECLPGHFVSQYADDTSIILAEHLIQELSASGSQVVEQMQEWCNNHALKLNADKTGLMTFSKTVLQNSLLVKCNNKSLQGVPCLKFLGVHIDSCLTWIPHIDTLVRKLNSFCALLRRLREELSLNTLKQIYYASVQSLITYSVMFWGSSTEAMSVFIAQKRIIRCMLRLPPRTSCRPYFTDLGLLTVPALYILMLAIFAKKHLHLFNANADHYAEGMSIITRGRAELSIPTHHSAFFQRSPAFAAIKIYNRLPLVLRQEKTMMKFKKETAKYLLDKCIYTFDLQF